jgi:hypothetical protein
MASVRNNKYGQIIVNYGNGKSISLIPGVTLNINDEEWEQAKKNPVCKIYLDQGILEELYKEPETKGELAGFQVTEDDNDEPTPVVKSQESSTGKKTKSKRGRPKKTSN